MNAQATKPLLPEISAGTPGRVSPASRRPSKCSSARYQRFGTPSARCMSPATIAPEVVRSGEAAQLLLPETGDGPGFPDLSGAAGAERPRARTSGPGIAGRGKAGPTSGASRSVPGGSRKAASSAGSASRSAAARASRSPVVSFSTKYIAVTASSESASRQAAGVRPSSRYSNGGCPSAPSPAFTPSR